MVRYRFLTDEELKALDEEFKHFLIANGLHAEEWEELNKNDPDKAIEIVGLFSDLVLDKVYDKTEFILYQNAKSLNVFKFFKEKAILIGVDYQGRDDFPLEGVMEFISKNAEKMLIYSSSKSFDEVERNKEIHHLIKYGAFATDDKIFNFLAEIKKV
jgi:hypothetical protein